MSKHHRPPFIVQQCRQDVNAGEFVAAAMRDALLLRETPVFKRSQRGRPFVQAPYADLDCNWSHSGELLAYTYSDMYRVGIDIERTSAGNDKTALAKRFFRASESHAIEHGADFISLWVMKEALLKAIGQGLAHGLKRVEFAWQNGKWQLAMVESSLCAQVEWDVALIPVPEGFVGALAWRPQYTDPHDDD